MINYFTMEVTTSNHCIVMIPRVLLLCSVNHRQSLPVSNGLDPPVDFPVSPVLHTPYWDQLIHHLSIASTTRLLVLALANKYPCHRSIGLLIGPRGEDQHSLSRWRTKVVMLSVCNTNEWQLKWLVWLVESAAAMWRAIARRRATGESEAANRIAPRHGPCAGQGDDTGDG